MAVFFFFMADTLVQKKAPTGATISFHGELVRQNLRCSICGDLKTHLAIVILCGAKAELKSPPRGPELELSLGCPASPETLERGLALDC